jgi:glutaredoxin-like YruB-family protein
MKKVKIYTAPGCPFCVLAKEYLKEKGVEFEEIDVSKDERGIKEVIEKTGQLGVPVLEIDSEIVIGFDKEKIDQILNLK